MTEEIEKRIGELDTKRVWVKRAIEDRRREDRGYAVERRMLVQQLPADRRKEIEEPKWGDSEW